MENASKALIMAGGILIALLVAGALIMMFSQLTAYQRNSDISKKQEQVAKFNDQFEPYNKQSLTVMELKSVCNKIESNNKKNEGYPEYQITVTVQGESGTNGYTKYINDFDSLTENAKISLRFKCVEVKYSENTDNKLETGRIKSMKFKITKDEDGNSV